MSGWGGFVELVLVFGLVIGFGVYQLRSVRRASREAGDHDLPKSKNDETS